MFKRRDDFDQPWLVMLTMLVLWVFLTAVGGVDWLAVLRGDIDAWTDVTINLLCALFLLRAREAGEQISRSF